MCDLSYNNLKPNDLLSLGLLPELRVLHLTGNSLTQLPVDLAHPMEDEFKYTIMDFILINSYYCLVNINKAHFDS